MTSAWNKDLILCDEKTPKSSNTDCSIFNKLSNEKLVKIDENPVANQNNIEVSANTQTCSRQLEMYLESRGIQPWDEQYTCIGEIASASTSSLESHEMISEGNSSGYNSSSIDCSTIKSKRDSDSLSESSQSDSGELQCTDSHNSSSLNNTLHDLSRSMVEILKCNHQNAEMPNTQVSSSCCDDDNCIEDNNIDFHEAVRRGDVKQVEKLVASGFIEDLNEPDWNVSGDPPLLVAATNHNLPMLSVLLSNGCDPGVRSPRGETALHRVILNGGPGNVVNFVKELLDYGCSPCVKEAGGGLTALHILARQLAHAQASRNLHHNFEEALETLSILAKAGTVNDKDHQGRSALHILASSTTFDNNHKIEIESIIRIMLGAGADPTVKNNRGETPLHESLECGALIIAELLMPHTPAGIISRYGETPLHIAARKNYIEIVAQLLKNNEDPSLQDARGNTPLHLASARGFHQVVSLLVTSSLVQLEKVNDDGLTALQVAAESGFINAVSLLLKAGADPTLMTKRTTLHHRHPDICTLIDHEVARRHQLAT